MKEAQAYFQTLDDHDKKSVMVRAGNLEKQNPELDGDGAFIAAMAEHMGRRHKDANRFFREQAEIYQTERPKTEGGQIAEAVGQGFLTTALALVAGPLAASATMGASIFGHKYEELTTNFSEKQQARISQVYTDLLQMAADTGVDLERIDNDALFSMSVLIALAPDGGRIGLEHEDALWGALLSAGGQMPIEYLGNVFGLKFLFGALKPGPLGAFALNVGKAGASGAVEEYTQNFPDLFATIRANHPEWTYKQCLDEFLKRLPEKMKSKEWKQTAWTGAIAEAFFPFFLGGGAVRNRVLFDLYKVKEARIELSNLGLLDLVIKRFDKSKMTAEQKRLAVLDMKIAGEDGIVREVFITAAAVQKLIESGEEGSYQPVLDAAGVTAEDVNKIVAAEGSEGLLTIPVEDYVPLLGTDSMAAILNDRKLSKGGMTANEFRQFEQERAEEIKRLGRIFQGEEEAGTRADREAKIIYDAVLGSQMEAGIRRSEAKGNAAVFAAYTSFAARRGGESPLALLGKFAPGVRVVDRRTGEMRGSDEVARGSDYYLQPEFRPAPLVNFRVLKGKGEAGLHDGPVIEIEENGIPVEYQMRVAIPESGMGGVGVFNHKGKDGQWYVSNNKRARNIYNALAEGFVFAESEQAAAELARELNADLGTDEFTVHKWDSGDGNPSYAAVRRDAKTEYHFEEVAPKGEESQGREAHGAQIFFEVAPDPDNVELTERWQRLTPEQQNEISWRIINKYVPRIMEEMGIPGLITQQIGGFEGHTNHSFALILESAADIDKVQEITHRIGWTLSQKGMMAVNEQEFGGSFETGILTIELPDGSFEAVEDLYNRLRTLEKDGQKLIMGNTTVGNEMVIVNNDELISVDELAKLVDDFLGNEYNISHHQGFVSWPEKEDYNYAGDEQGREAASVSRGASWENADRYRSEASGELEAALAAAEAGRAGPDEHAGPGGPEGLDSPQESGRFVSARRPNNKGVEDDPRDIKKIDLDTVKSDPGMFKKLADLVSNKVKNVHLNSRGEPQVSRYMLVRDTDNGPPKNDEEAVERFIEAAVGNLRWLYNQVPQDMRERNKGWFKGTNRWAKGLADRYGVTTSQVAAMTARLSPRTEWYQNAAMVERILDVWHGRQDHAWDEKMEATAERIFGKYPHIVKAISGKALRELTGNRYIAAWIRVYDETYNDPRYRVLTPEGDYGDYCKTDCGKENYLGWALTDNVSMAVSILRNGSPENVHDRLGYGHKIRSFYNNIIGPTADLGFVTIDTHAIAAAHLRPFSINSPEVMDSMKGPPSSEVTGAKGMYALYVEAYQRLARELGILPQELQSVAWTAAKGLFSSEMKLCEKDVAEITSLWEDYVKGKVEIDYVRNEIYRRAKGIDSNTRAERSSRASDRRPDSPDQERIHSSELGRAGLRRGHGTGGSVDGHSGIPDGRADGPESLSGGLGAERKRREHHERRAAAAQGRGHSAGNDRDTAPGTRIPPGGNTRTGTVELHHWSEKEGLSALDPDHSEAALSGLDKKRKQRYARHWVNRTYYCIAVSAEGGSMKPAGAGRRHYIAQVPYEDLYDYKQDPDGLLNSLELDDPTDWDEKITAYEKAIKDAGYAGFWMADSPTGPSAAMFEAVTPETEILDEAEPAKRDGKAKKERNRRQGVNDLGRFSPLLSTVSHIKFESMSAVKLIERLKKKQKKGSFTEDEAADLFYWLGLIDGPVAKHEVMEFLADKAAREAEGERIFGEGEADAYRKALTEAENLMDRPVERALDYGAGRGHGTEALRESAPEVRAYEPDTNLWIGAASPDYTRAAEIEGEFDLVAGINVLDAVGPVQRAVVLKDMIGKIAPGGVAVISVRKWNGKVETAENATPSGENKAAWVKKASGRTVYRKGFDGAELLEFVQKQLSENGEYEVVKLPWAKGNAVAVVRRDKGEKHTDEGGRGGTELREDAVKYVNDVDELLSRPKVSNDELISLMRAFPSMDGYGHGTQMSLEEEHNRLSLRLTKNMRTQGVRPDLDPSLWGTGRDEKQNIVNPIDPNLSQEEKVALLRMLTDENAALLDRILPELDRRLGTVSKYNKKTPKSILNKANRPSVKEQKPWFDVEHVRDSFRFKVLINNLTDVIELVKLFGEHGIEIIEADTVKMIEPLAWGWRMAAFDLRMPNGQIVECYTPFPSMDEAKDAGGNHILFEKWRGKTKEEIAANIEEYKNDRAESRRIYEEAWMGELARLGLSSNAAIASWINVEREVSSLTSANSSISSSAVGMSLRHVPSGNLINVIELEATQTRPSSMDRQTEWTSDGVNSGLESDISSPPGEESIAPEEEKVKRKKGPLYQKVFKPDFTPGQARGMVSFDTVSGKPLITLFENADESSFLHESGHVFLEMFKYMASQNGAPEGVLRDWIILCRELGIGDDGLITREAHEKFARSLEHYFREGKAPSLRLVEVFEQFSGWLREIYKKFTDLGAAPSPELKRVFDRMFATEEEIEQANAFYEQRGSFAKGMEGVRNAERRRYEDLRRKAGAEAFDRRLRERTRALYMALEDEDELEKQAAEAIKETPLYVAIAEAGEKGGLDLTLVMDELGDPEAVEALREKWPGLIAEQGGRDPGLLAAKYGFKNAGEILNLIKRARKPEEAAEVLTEALIEEKEAGYRDLLKDIPPGEIAYHNDVQLEVLAAEAEMISGVLGREAGPEQSSMNIKPEELREQARAELAGKTAAEAMDYRGFSRAEISAARKARKAKEAGDLKEALVWKQREAMYHALVIEAMEAAMRFEKSKAGFRREGADGND